MSKYNVVDLFAGCGGLSEGFEESKHFNVKAYIEWEKSPCDTLQKRLIEKWKRRDTEKLIFRFDIQRTAELLNGWKNDEEYGSNKGLVNHISADKINIIIGGPPCQAYSLAGRIRDEFGMHNDYRNYLFESYLSVVKKLKPQIFLFENVQGILSAKPGGVSIIDRIISDFNKNGYEVVSNLRELALINLKDYGVPQNRNRVIILGIKRSKKVSNIQNILEAFYKEILPKYKAKRINTVDDAIMDLPGFYPLSEYVRHNAKRYSHSPHESDVSNHSPRFHNLRDINTFKVLAEDIEMKNFEYISTDKLKKLYTELTGKTSSVHKYYVLRRGDVSNTIPAHLYKDGLRHIHPDSKQARTLTIREAARLQGFEDDFIFTGSMTDQYKMIGNAVPPSFSKVLASSIYELICQHESIMSA